MCACGESLLSPPHPRHLPRGFNGLCLQVNEIAWNNRGDLFFMTIATGCLQVFTFPAMSPVHQIIAHTGTCIAVKFDPQGRYVSQYSL